MIKESVSLQRVTFAVDDVTPATTRLLTVSPKEAMEAAIKSTIISSSNTVQPVLKDCEFHPLIAAAALAFKQHYPLVLSPDMLWLAVLQGTAHHINNHAEALRSRITSHLTKVELVIDTGLYGLPADDATMLSMVQKATAAISRHIHPDKRFLFETQFSTTGNIEQIAYAVSLMDAFQAYFDYIFQCICGIPSITLEGSPEDWELFATKVDALHRSDLDLTWWTSHLLPLCHQLVRAARGDVNLAHWKDIFKLTKHYGAEELNGWLLKFIPYIQLNRNDTPTHRNPLLEPGSLPPDYTNEKLTGCYSHWLPNGLSGAPVTWMNQATGNKTPLKLVAGFVGIHQSEQDLSLRPAISWAVAAPCQIDALLSRLRSEHTVEPPAKIDLRELFEIFRTHLPADFWRFYTQTNGAIIRFRDPDASAVLGQEVDVIRCWINAVDRFESILDFESVENELKLLRKRLILTPKEFEERRNFAFSYSRLKIFATSREHGKQFTYLFGSDPESFNRVTQKSQESRGTIFRWSGELTPESFEPVAHTFAEWLEKMLNSVTKS